MMRVMSNGEIGSIKKQIFLVLGLFFSYSNFSIVACPQTVGVVTPGEAIWQVTSRIGQATNVIESQLCALNVGTGFECSFAFDQTDIGVGGIYTISAPGIYCLKENVTFSVGPAITINSSNVTVNLEGHYIDGGSNPLSATIQLATGVGSNLNTIIIQNGTIQNIGDGTINNGNGIIQGGTNSTLANVTIRDMTFFNIIDDTLGSRAFSGAVQGLLIENCSIFNGGVLYGFAAAGGAVVRNIRAEQYVNGRCGLSIIPGSGTPWQSVVVEDCIMTCSAPGVGSSANIVISSAFNAVVRNCVVDGSYSTGFSLSGINNLVVSDCIAQNSFGFGSGFQIVSPASAFSGVIIERCVAQYNSQDGFNVTQSIGSIFDYLNIIDCDADDNTHNGFLLDSVSGNGCQNIIFKGCNAAANGLCGFLMLGEGGSILDSVFEDCVAQGNSGDGFSLLNTNAAFTIQNVVFNSCVSQRNLGGTNGTTIWRGDGFGIGSASNNAGPIFDVVCQSCVAQDNIHDGFNLVATVTGCKILDCCAMHNTGTGIANVAGNTNRVLGNAAFNNGGADISGVSDLSLLVSSALAGALAGATRWVNAIS